QTFATTPSASPGAGGTSFDIRALPEKPFALNFFARRDGVVTTGVITFDLIDGSGNVIADSASTNNTLAVAYTSLTTSYAAFNVVFRLPANAPTTVKLRMRPTT